MRGDGAPEKIRTSDLQLRRLPLYPAELRAHLCYQLLTAYGFSYLHLNALAVPAFVGFVGLAMDSRYQIG